MLIYVLLGLSLITSFWEVDHYGYIGKYKRSRLLRTTETQRFKPHPQVMKHVYVAFLLSFAGAIGLVGLSFSNNEFLGLVSRRTVAAGYFW